MKFIVVLCLILSVFNRVFGEDDQSMVKAIVVLTGPNTKANGTVLFGQKLTGGPVDVQVNIQGLEPGTKHGFHIHEKGDLTNGCASLGGHYNPAKHDHGGPNATVRHAGDLGNVVADSNGNVKIVFSDSVMSIVGGHSILGRGVVLHEGEDDLGLGGTKDSLTTGNAGGRLACGVIGIESLTDEIPSSPSLGTQHGILGSALLFGLCLDLFV